MEAGLSTHSKESVLASLLLNQWGLGWLSYHRGAFIPLRAGLKIPRLWPESQR